jgi:hypothetical protein
MSIKRLMGAVFGGLLAISAMSALAQDTKTEDGKESCCVSGDGAASCCSSSCDHRSGKMRCSLTGKATETCCCVHKEGKLHCTLADKDVDTCCCRPVGDEVVDETAPDDAQQ